MKLSELQDESLKNQEEPLVKACFEKFKELISIDAEVVVGKCEYDALVLFSKIISHKISLSTLNQPVVLGIRDRTIDLAQNNDIVKTYLEYVIPVHEATHVEFRMFDPRFNESTARCRVVLYYQSDLTLDQYTDEIRNKRDQIAQNIDQLSNSQGRFILTSEVAVTHPHITGETALELAYYDLAVLTTQGINEWEDSFFIADIIIEEILVGDLRKQYPQIFNSKL